MTQLVVGRHRPSLQPGGNQVTEAMARETRSGTKRRGRGEDSVYFDATTGRWCATVSMGRRPDGSRARHKVSAKTKPEALAKLKDLRRSLDNGVQGSTGRLTVGTYLDGWADSLDPRVRPNTADQYRFTVRCHLRPGLGGKLARQAHPGGLRLAMDVEAQRRFQAEHDSAHAGGVASRRCTTRSVMDWCCATSPRCRAHLGSRYPTVGA